jgi:hypothetical protein
VKVDASCVYMAVPGGTLQAMVTEPPEVVLTLLRNNDGQGREARLTGLEGKPVIITARGADALLAVWGITADLVDPRIARPGGHG